MPRRATNVNLTDTRRAIRAHKLEGVDFRMKLEPGGAVIFESTAGKAVETDEPFALDEWRSKRGQG